jgi:hypothetical protein
MMHGRSWDPSILHANSIWHDYPGNVSPAHSTGGKARLCSVPANRNGLNMLYGLAVTMRALRLRTRLRLHGAGRWPLQEGGFPIKYNKDGSVAISSKPREV